MKTLQEAKQEISSRFLGHDGIQGVGLRASENAVCVYLEEGTCLEGTLREQMAQTAAPYAVVTQESGRAVLAGNGRSSTRNPFKRLLQRLSTHQL